MFLISITKHPINKKAFSAIQLREVRFKSFFVSLAYDEFFSSLEEKESHVAFSERITDRYSFEGNGVLLRMSFDIHSGTLKITKPTHSGRQIYYSRNNNGEFFCSTHISLLRKCGVKIEENDKAIPEFMIYRFIMPPCTLYKDIFVFASGDKAVVSINENGCSITFSKNPWIDLYGTDKKRLRSSHIDTVQEKIEENIAVLKGKKTQTDFLLSGGLDSSILFALGKKHLGTEESYSTAYPFEKEENNKEKVYALSASKAFGSRHHFYEPSIVEYLYGVVEAISAAEEPVHHMQSVLLYLLFKNGLPKGNRIIVNGQGVGFFGVAFHRELAACARHSFLYNVLGTYPISYFLNISARILGKGGSGLAVMTNSRKLLRSYEDPDHTLWALGAYGDEKWVMDYFGAGKKQIVRNRFNIVKGVKDFPIYDIVAILDLMGNECLTQAIWSKLGEANKSLVYYPLTSLEVGKVISSIAWEDLLSTTMNVKRKLAENVGVAEFITQRPKSAFGIRAERWAKKGGGLEPLVSLASKIFDEKEIRKLQSKDYHKAMTFWNILNYAIWKRLHIQNESVETLLGELKENPSYLRQ